MGRTNLSFIMVLLQFGADIGKYMKDIRNSYIPISSISQKQQGKDDLRDTLTTMLATPLKIEYYLWMWVVYSFYAVVKMIVLLPFELVIGIFHNCLSILQITFSTYTTFFSLITLVVSFIYQQEQFSLFDPSQMYHTFRGQSSLKLYGLMFAIEIGEKIFTMVGRYLYTNLKEKLEDPSNYASMISLLPEIIITVLYTCMHTFVIYLEYNIYIVVINNSVPNFIIFIFVINLTKMKSVAMKKSDPKTYQAQINLDAKDRLQKTLYLILFQLSQSNRSIVDIHFKLVFIFVVGPIIEHVKHMTVLRLSPQIGNITTICNKTFYNFYISSDYRTFIKCLNNDFTVIPFTVFFVKMITVILYSDEKVFKISNEETLSTYIFLCLLLLFLKILMLVIRKMNILGCNIEEEERSEQAKDEPEQEKSKVKKKTSLKETKSMVMIQDDKESINSQGNRRDERERANSQRMRREASSQSLDDKRQKELQRFQ